MIQSSTPGLPATLTYGRVLGRVIASRRQQAGIEQQAVAAVLGIGQSAYSRLENGQTAMGVGQLFGVATALGVEPNALVAETDRHVQDLQARGVAVTMEQPTSTSEILIGLGILAALIAAATR